MPKYLNTVIDDGFIREILVDIVENGYFPHESFEIKHINAGLISKKSTGFFETTW